MNEFVYDRMTPELQSYFTLCEARPPYRHDDPTTHEPSRLWREQCDAAQKALEPSGEPAAYYKAKKLWLCRDETASDPKEHVSPSGNYRLVVTRHKTGEGTWSYTKGRVYRGEELLATVCRNYSSFPFAWVEGHKGTGHDYLICGENYQGQTIVDLTTKERRDSLPADAAKGWGFCWASIYPSPDGLLLAVVGCYWACPYETIIVDFSDPLVATGLPTIHRDEDDAFGGWLSPDSCTIGQEFEVVDLPGHALDGKKEYDCTLEDLGAVETYVRENGVESTTPGLDAGWKNQFIGHTWTRATR